MGVLLRKDVEACQSQLDDGCELFWSWALLATWIWSSFISVMRTSHHRDKGNETNPVSLMLFAAQATMSSLLAASSSSCGSAALACARQIQLMSPCWIFSVHGLPSQCRPPKRGAITPNHCRPEPGRSVGWLHFLSLLQEKWQQSQKCLKWEQVMLGVVHYLMFWVWLIWKLFNTCINCMWSTREEVCRK